MPGYVTAVSGVQRPMGVAASSSGDRLWVGETEGDRVARVFDAGGTEVGQMLPPISSGPSHVPVYLAVDPITLEVYVTDRLTGAIFIYDGAGTYQRQFTPPAELTGWQPLGLTFDAAGNLYVSDVGSNPQRVVELDRSGAVVRSIGADAGLSFPNGIAVDGAGYTYVTDGNNGRLLVFDQTGAIVARVGRGVGEGDLGLPRGIAIDGKQRVYVADSSGQAVFVYGVYQPGTDRLEYLGSFGQQGIGNGQFEFPNGLALDGRGRVYVTDSANDRVQVWSY
jgi:DNA-binding beta-propeller fold protein YncE